MRTGKQQVKNMTTLNTKQSADWEEEFDKQFSHTLSMVESDLLKDFIRQERQRLLDEVIELVGEDDLIREKEDMLENQYHRAKGRNQLRAQLREKLQALR